MTNQCCGGRESRCVEAQRQRAAQPAAPTSGAWAKSTYFDPVWSVCGKIIYPQSFFESQSETIWFVYTVLYNIKKWVCNIDAVHGKSTSQSGFGLPSFLSISLTGAAAAAVALLGSARSALRSSSSSRLSSRSSLVSVPLKVGSSRCSAQLLAWRRGSG